MPLEIYTSRMGYTGPDWLDVSLQGNLKRAETEIGGHRGCGFWFAPPPSLLYPYLSARRFGRETPELQAKYRAEYLEHLRNRYRGATRKAFDLVLSWPRVVLLCFCKPGEFCHRVLLAEALELTGRRHGVEVLLRGELAPSAIPEGAPFWLSPAVERRDVKPDNLVLKQPGGEQITIAGGEGLKCRPFEIADASGAKVGGGFICGGRAKSTKCRGLPGCTRKSKYLCDYPLAGEKAGKTCDRPLCAACAKTVGSDLHYCPSHHMLDPEARAVLR